MGAWIETEQLGEHNEGGQSLPTWERGLKLYGCGFARRARMSLPTWERGLKHVCYCYYCYCYVAPHVGAWIETFVSMMLSVNK